MILCHGYGAPGTDLVPLAEELLSLDSDLQNNVSFIFPQAPLSLEAEGIPGGRAWWLINMARLQQLLQTNQISELISAEPPGLIEARGLFLEFLQALKEEYSVGIDRCVLGGFSQGAMLTTDVTLRLEQAPAGLCIYSGTMICAEEWVQLAPRRASLPVIQTHGKADPILPFAAAELLSQLLQQNGLDITFQPFMGGHTITWQALELTVKLLQKLQ